MTVAELLEQLKDINPDLPVQVDVEHVTLGSLNMKDGRLDIRGARVGAAGYGQVALLGVS